jgi:hypothetical protein
MPNKPKLPSEQGQSAWGDILPIPIHPAAAELFSMMSPDELRELGEDIKANGLRVPIAITSDGKLLDGRNRLAALMAVGVEFKLGRTTNDGPICVDIVGGDLSFAEVVKGDPYAYVVSTNLRRRHLTAEQKRETIAKLIKAQPEKPDLQIAKTVKASPTTVGTVRRELEAKGDVSNLETRTDTKGRRQPARKRSLRNMRRNGLIRAEKLGEATVKKLKGTSLESAAEQNELIVLNRGAVEGSHTPLVKRLIAEAIAGKDVSALATSKNGVTPAMMHDDGGSDSTSEIELLRARNEQLETENARLLTKIAGLESELEEAKTAAKSPLESKSGFRCSLCREIKPAVLRPVFICDGCINIYDVREAAPPPDDGLNTPEILLRKPKEMVS